MAEIKTMEIKTNVEPYDGYVDADHSFSFTLDINIHGIIINIDIYNPYMYTREKWIEFCRAIHDRQYYYLDFYQGSGTGYLECDGNYFISSSCPSGAGGDLSTKVKIDIHQYGDSIIDAIMALIHDKITFNVWKPYDEV